MDEPIQPGWMSLALAVGMLVLAVLIVLGIGKDMRMLIEGRKWRDRR